MTPSRTGTSRTKAESAEWRELLVGRLQDFVRDWKGYRSTEQAGAQPFLQKLLDIYEVRFEPGTIFEQHPVRVPVRGKKSQRALFEDVEPRLEFETKRMDMYLPKICVWEMKGPDEVFLDAHHGQLLDYWARMRPRYMVLCNFKEFWIYDTSEEHGQLAPRLKLPLLDLPSHPEALLFLRGEAPDLADRSERVTAEVASAMGRLVRDLVEASDHPDRDRNRIARFALECVFAMFAEDTELIPSGMFTEAAGRSVEEGSLQPIWQLFDDFAKEGSSRKLNRLAPYVNGPLFDRSQPRIALTKKQIAQLHLAARDFDWRDVRPEIFGTIFEQALSAVERHELGAHYTRETDIERVVFPTVIAPWRERILNLRTPKEAEVLVEQMKGFHVLDPACGCGDFLYVVYREMKRLEASLAKKWTVLQRKVAKRLADVKPPPPGPWFGLQQLHGIELNEFAAFLARVVLWIGEHLAARELGLDDPILPLKNLDDTVVHGDALFTEWPRPDGELAIVGNPPYLGVRKMRRELGDEAVEKLFERYPDNRAADFVTYWFTVALDTLRPGERAGFVATNSIAQNESREASLDRIAQKGGTITDAWKSYPWPGDAAVHVAIVNWVMGPWEGIRTLDGEEVASIPPSLSSTGDVTAVGRIKANEGLCFMGVTPGNNGFVLTEEERRAIVAEDRKSADVIKPFLIGRDVNREVDQKPTRWIVDFATMGKEEAEGFAGAMRWVKKNVYPERRNNPREKDFKNWWQFWRAASDMRAGIDGMKQVLVLSRVSPRVAISRAAANVCFDNTVFVLALGKPYHFGVLQSALHAKWARARGSTLKGDLRYTNTTVFETFPFPLQKDGTYDPRKVPQTPAAERVSEAAETFEKARAEACRERKLGLTKIHNLLEASEDGPLGRAWVALNDAVIACYGFPKGTWRDETATLAKLMELNRKVAGG